LVEFHRQLFKEQRRLDIGLVKDRMTRFYAAVNDAVDLSVGKWIELWAPEPEPVEMDDVFLYYDAALQATNDRVSRKKRGDVIKKLLTA